MLTDIAQKEPIQEGATQTLFGLVDRFLLGHFQRAGGGAVFADELVNLVEIAFAPYNRQVAPPQALGDDWRHQPRHTRYRQGLHQNRRIHFDNTVPIMKLDRQVVLLLEEILNIVPDAGEFRLELV